MLESDEAQAMLEKIFAQRRIVADLGAVYLEAADAAKVAKKEWEGAQTALERLILSIEEESDPARHPLFATKAPGEPVVASGDAPAVNPAPGDESWRDEPLASLGLTPGLVEDMADQGFKTVGHLADWSKSGHNLTDIKGVGPVAAGKIEDALAEFWAKRLTASSADPEEVHPAAAEPAEHEVHQWEGEGGAPPVEEDASSRAEPAPGVITEEVMDEAEASAADGARKILDDQAARETAKPKRKRKKKPSMAQALGSLGDI